MILLDKFRYFLCCVWKEGGKEMGMEVIYTLIEVVLDESWLEKKIGDFYKLYSVVDYFFGRTQCTKRQYKNLLCLFAAYKKSTWFNTAKPWLLPWAKHSLKDVIIEIILFDSPINIKWGLKQEYIYSLKAFTTVKGDVHCRVWLLKGFFVDGEVLEETEMIVPSLRMVHSRIRHICTGKN